jgi:deazaflavin-dependent oxidoreductase (nitroreductase family)
MCYAVIRRAQFCADASRRRFAGYVEGLEDTHMVDEISPNDERLRQMFKIGNRFMVLLFRLGLGGWGNGPQTSQVMVLVHKGRKSGLLRKTPVNYAIVDDMIYCAAAFGSRADWYRNVLADPHVQVWLPDGWYAGEAEEMPDDDPQRNALMRQVLIASGFAAPLFAGVNPKTLSDERLAEITAPYRLMRIYPTEACTGSGGPGDLASVWPAATFVLLGLLLRGGRRKRG